MSLLLLSLTTPWIGRGGEPFPLALSPITSPSIEG